MRRSGLDAAYGRRRKSTRVVRRAVNAGFRLVAEPLDRADLDFLHFWPPVEDAATLADLSARVNWHLPDLSVPVYIPGATGEVPDPAAAPHMDPALVSGRVWTADRPRGRPWYVLHDVTAATTARQLPRLRRTTVADPELYYTSELGYRRLRTALAPAAATTVGDGGALFRRRSAGLSSLVLGTGPSAAELDLTAIDADIRITCNSSVRDESLMAALQPDVLAFSDPVFHFGPSRYAAAFRADVVRATQRSDLKLVVPTTFTSLLAAHLPDLCERIVELSPTSSTWRWPTSDAAIVRPTGNVLTFLMLPVAFGLSDRVAVAGCDGRQPTENYFWKHNSSAQYSDELMRDVFDAHPAFFRDRSYSDYYDKHCRELEELIQTAEGSGKTVHAVTSSWIPSLAARRS